MTEADLSADISEKEKTGGAQAQDEAQKRAAPEPAPLLKEERTTRVAVRSVRELGALLRIARQRLNLSQTDAAICCGVGRRFYVELENGKATVRMDKVFPVLDALGLQLSLGGPGTAFTVKELAGAAVKLDKNEPEHVWEADFSKNVTAPYEETVTATGPGRRIGAVANRWQRPNAVRTNERVLRVGDEETSK